MEGLIWLTQKKIVLSWLKYLRLIESYKNIFSAKNFDLKINEALKFAKETLLIDEWMLILESIKCV